jgi:hypothetical protein
MDILESEKQSISWKTIAMYSLEFLFFTNILFLDFFVVYTIIIAPQQKQAATIQPQQQTQQTVITTPTPITTTLTPTTAPIIQQPTKYVPAAPQVKEYYIPFGTGQGSSGDWQSISGMQATVDSANYPRIKRAVFEVTVHVPNATQQVDIRLFNTSDSHPVWYSDATSSGVGLSPQLIISQPVTLDSGSKLYSVQMKTQLQALAIIDQARLHITLY